MNTPITPQAAHVALVRKFENAVRNRAFNPLNKAPLDAVVEARNEVLNALAQPALAAPVENPLLRKFLDAAGGEGLVLDGVDAGDLYVSMYRYAPATQPTPVASPAPGALSALCEKWGAEDAAAQSLQPVEASPDADMFWDNDDSERQHHSIHDLIIEGGFGVGDIVTIQCAARLPNIKVRVIVDPNNEDELIFEDIEDAPAVEVAAPVAPIDEPHPEYIKGFSSGWDHAVESYERHSALSAAKPELSDAQIMSTASLVWEDHDDDFDRRIEFAREVMKLQAGGAEA